MPIGDPHGGNFTYTDEGLPQCIFVAMVPVRDLDRSIVFYRDLLGMTVTYHDDEEIGLKRENARLTLRRSTDVGVDTGIYFGVDDPYDLHRRLIDEGVVFTEDPKRMSWGVCTAFRDPDGNVLRAIEMGAEPRSL